MLPITYRLANPNKVDLVDAIVVGRKLIEDDNVSIEIKDVIFALIHVVVDLVEKLEDKR